MTSEPIAIVGMGAAFPGAAGLGAYWENIAGGIDAISEVPASRWDPVYFDPSASAADRFYCRRGGFVEARFDPIAFGIMPVAVTGAEPDQLLALHVAAEALADAAYGAGRRAVPGERTGVILGRGGYPTPGVTRLANRVRTAQQLVTTLAELVPDLDAATLEQVRAAFQARAGELGPETAIGLVPNLAASRIANRFDLHGPAYTVDAACASSLLAVDQACAELAMRRCDLVLAGGVHVCHDVTFWSVFTQLGALSRAQRIRPFDRRADGILIGEGAGLVVLKRLADAERDGDRVYAVIRGAGVSSDGRESSAMRPSADGQHTALDRAWRAAGCDPAAVGLVEAHGTGTPAGDEVELTALGRFFGAPPSGPRAVLGSVKSMIGHAMPAAGAAGLIKTALALYHGILPPSLHCDEPHAALDRTRFRVLGSAEPWGELPRRAGVSAFGFGGINAHVVVEAHGAVRPAHRWSRAARPGRPVTSPLRAALPPVLMLAADSIEGLGDALDTAPLDDPALGAPIGVGAMRLALLAPTPERRVLARKVLARGRAWRGNHDIWFAPRGLATDGGTVAFLFSGIEVAFAPNIGDIAAVLGRTLDPAIAAAHGADWITPRALEVRCTGVIALGRLLAEAIAQLGVQPAMFAGHSIGEWTAMVASEMIPPAVAEAFLADLRTISIEVPDVVFAAAGCSAAGVQAALAGLDAIAVSHDNCPHQSIVCGRRDRVRIAIDRLGARGVLCQELPFRSGFHSPLFIDYLAPHRRYTAATALQRPLVPVWSATTAAPYPDAPDAIRALVIDHLVQPVRFRELIENLYASGARAFVQLGVGSLVGFTDDTLRGRDYLAIAAASDKHPGLGQLARVAAALWVDGFAGPDAPAASRMASPAPRATSIALELGTPLVRLGGTIAPLAIGSEARIDASGDPILAELLATLDDAATASRAVVDAYRARARSQPAAHAASVTSRRTLSVDAVPTLIDHCIFPQPDGWPTVSDRYPIVPMTMMIAMMIDAARALAPGQVAIAIEEVRAYRWLAVAPPVEVELIATRRNADHVEVELSGYARAMVVFADGYPAAAPPPVSPVVNPRPTPAAERMYTDRWMFHGPAYRGVVGLGPIGDDGVDGVIEVLPAPGALLDCAGQLVGWWVMQTGVCNRLALPVRIERVALFAPEPAVGARVACHVRMRHIDEREARADLELRTGDCIWAQISGWEERRFDSDEVLWAVYMYPEDNVLAEPAGGGYMVATEHWRTTASRELVMRRYLGERERAEYDQLGPRAKRGWLLGRIALKDAVRLHLWGANRTPLWPVEVEVSNEASGRPAVAVRGRRDLRVSVAHKDEVAVALVAETGEVGIDIERVEPRPPEFAAVAFTAAEIALGGDRDPDEWLARLWAAKEAVGKARGTGMTDPRALTVRAAAGDQLTIDDAVIDTRRAGAFVIAWTTRLR